MRSLSHLDQKYSQPFCRGLHWKMQSKLCLYLLAEIHAHTVHLRLFPRIFQCWCIIFTKIVPFWTRWVNLTYSNLSKISVPSVLPFLQTFSQRRDLPELEMNKVKFMCSQCHSYKSCSPHPHAQRTEPLCSVDLHNFFFFKDPLSSVSLSGRFLEEME